MRSELRQYVLRTKVSFCMPRGNEISVLSGAQYQAIGKIVRNAPYSMGYLVSLAGLPPCEIH